MGGRGTMLRKKPSERIPEYKTVDRIAGIKVLESIEKRGKLPEISNTPNTSYILLTPKGELKQLRTYDYSRHPKLDIDFDHPHNKIKPHIHFYGNREKDFRALTAKEKKKYKRILEEADVRSKRKI
jgi:hypothetical protein